MRLITNSSNGPQAHSRSAETSEGAGGAEWGGPRCGQRAARRAVHDRLRCAPIPEPPSQARLVLALDRSGEDPRSDRTRNRVGLAPLKVRPSPLRSRQAAGGDPPKPYRPSKSTYRHLVSVVIEYESPSRRTTTICC